MMWGVGVIRLVKRMEQVHSYALGWVIGAFRTSPVGSREIVAGIPPLKIILNMCLQGMTARLLSLGEHHTLYCAWTLRWLPHTISRTPPRRRARHLPTNNPLIRLLAPEVREQFFPHHPIAQPGEWVSDIYSNQIFFDLSAPKKSSKFFDGWVRDLKAKILSLAIDGRSLIFSDSAYWTKTSRASYAFSALHNDTWHDTTGWCPAGSSFDTELAALEEAIQWTVVRRIPDPIFFIDNKAVLLSFLDLNTHSSQTASIRINLLLHDFLSKSDSTISFAYCPSHVGIEGNERANRLTKQGTALGPVVPVRILQSNFVNEFKRDMNKHWCFLAKSQTYKGRSWLPIRRKRRLFKPDIVNKKNKTFFLTLLANDIETTSCMACALTNQAPMGEYRYRFHPESPTHCKHCGPNVEHTRQHILCSCPVYAPLAASLTDWKRNRDNDKSWKKFFQDNPSALTFGDLLEDVH
ncbi:hypothetical protein AX14_007678 [Amanita brunnescens Koide BX004]|nr:hypothetical protein AX14_007678 [Amanita brunnescens Koide BX004]